MAHYIDPIGDPAYFCPDCGSPSFGPYAPDKPDLYGSQCFTRYIVVGICLDCGHVVDDLIEYGDDYTAWSCRLRETEPCRQPKETVSAAQS